MVLHDKYSNSPRLGYNGTFSGIDSAVVKLALLDDTYTKDLESHITFSDVSESEIDETSVYEEGGQALTGVELTTTGPDTFFTANDVVWEESNITASYAVLYEESSDSLLTVVDFEGTESSTNGDFKIEWQNGTIFEVQT